MRLIDLRLLTVGAAMICAAGLASAMKPTERLADTRLNEKIGVLIPERFDDWQVDPTIVPVQVSPDVQAKLDQIYSQVLSRTYVNRQGERIMLSIAYGTDQANEATQVHRPEFCYVAQGFQLIADSVGAMSTRFGAIPVKHLVARAGARNEPITYWIMVGDAPVLPGVRRKLAQMRYGLTGVIPDGMLVRMSSIERDPSRAYETQQRFLDAMLAAMPSSERSRFMGAPTAP